ncbi:MAG TPA: glycosyltransferase, partial [Flavobacteriales bacterium]|nr:glycosyltransferase [Flavobacteriales bacterium]
MRVLHITSWYGSTIAPHEAPFIGRHIASLAPHTSNMVWHIDVRPGERNAFYRRGPLADRTYLTVTTTRRWLLIEWMATLSIIWAWSTRDRSKPIDIINFHIAYPNCTRIKLLRWIMRRPMVITEHFSAYHKGFNAKSKGVRRIKNIFHAGVPVIVVSRSLQGDIERFVGSPYPPFHIIDNAVDERVFKLDPSVVPEEGRFFAIAGWRNPKRPDLLIGALSELRTRGLNMKLRLAGDGPYSPTMKQRISELRLDEHVTLLGQLDEEQVADEMRRAHALLHASDYETYSAVCAEALCC